MSARSLLIALFCFSIVAAYGPVFVLDKVEGYCFSMLLLNFSEKVRYTSMTKSITLIWRAIFCLE